MNIYNYLLFIIFLLAQNPQWSRSSTFTSFLDYTQRRTTVGSLDDVSVRRTDLYLTTHKTHNRQTYTTSVGFEPTVSVGEWPQTYALDRAATGTGFVISNKGNG